MADGFTNTFSVAGSASLAPNSGSATTLTFDVGGGASDVLAITGPASVGTATASINVNPIGTMSLAGTYTLISASSGLGSNFTLGGAGVFNYGNNGYTESLAPSTTAENLVLTAGPLAFATLFYNGSQSLTTLNATSGTNTNFSVDSAGTNNSGAQPVGITTLVFTGSNLSSATPLNTSLGFSYTTAGLQFTANCAGRHDH